MGSSQVLSDEQIKIARIAFYAAGWGQNEVMWKCWQQGMAFAEAEALKECEARIHQLENEYNYLKDQIERWKQPCEADARDAARLDWVLSTLSRRSTIDAAMQAEQEKKDA